MLKTIDFVLPNKINKIFIFFPTLGNFDFFDEKLVFGGQKIYDMGFEI